MIIKRIFQDISAGRDDQILSEVTRLLEKVPKEVRLKILKNNKFTFSLWFAKK